MTTERYHCSDASIGRDEPVAATASQVSGWLLIEVDGAWGVDAVNDSELGPHLPRGWKAAMQRRGIRPVCVRRPDRGDRHDGRTTLFHVRAARPGTAPPQAWTRELPSLGLVAAATDDLGESDGPGAGWEPYDGRIVLVCTNGRHDQCCANRGRPVVRELRESEWAAEVWECSHIGGDRFAANVVILPDSLYFGRCEPDDAHRILAAHAAGQIELPWFRGRSTFRYAEQAAELAIRRELSVTGLDDVVLDERVDPLTFRFSVNGLGVMDVAMDRQMVRVAEPLTCQGPGDQDIPQYSAVSITPVG